MVIRPNIKQNSGNLKDAASLLLRGATLLNDPCPSCAGVQVRFQNKDICINCCTLQDTVTQATHRESNANNEEAKMITDRELAKSIIQEKIMLVVQQLRDENDISSQKIKAELIELYLRIMEKARALEDPRYQGSLIHK
ncbi:MAG: Sjogren's syndrome/scleroderma autoantigen 1 family protein [Candidatus Nitrosopolaris sp.]